MHYNEANSYLFVCDIDNIKSKAKDYKIVPTPSCLGDILKEFSVDNMINSELNEYIYNFVAGSEAALVCYCF